VNRFLSKSEIGKNVKTGKEVYPQISKNAQKKTIVLFGVFSVVRG